ncbi:MAG: ABC transporter substrate-binding protein, partial [Roseiflexaceae bacterium]|nr:ABC transporter substrate-binding protein [Roseiflexaceae bacterium]
NAPAAAAPTAAGTVAQTGSTVDVTYWGSFSGGLGEAEQAMVSAFNESQGDVKVNYQFQGTYEETAQKLTAALQANNTPDVSLLSDVWWFKFYLAKAIAPLDDLAAGANIDFADFQPVLLEEGTRDGQHFWVPFARSTPLFYYNKDMWAEAGLPDRGPETWAEMTEWAPQLLQKDGDTITRAAFAHPSAASYVAWLFQGVIWQHGGEYSTPDFKITLNSPEGIRAAELYRQSVNGADAWAIASQDINKDFLGGVAASMMASTGGLAGYEKDATFQVGTAFLPKEENFGCCTGGAGLAVMAAAPAERQQAAMKFIEFATNTAGTTTWSQSTGYMPVRKSAVESADMKSFFQERPNFKVAVDQLPQTRAQDAARVFIAGGDQIIGKGLERIIVGNEDPATVWPDVTAELEKGAEPVLRDLAALGA